MRTITSLILCCFLGVGCSGGGVPQSEAPSKREQILAGGGGIEANQVSDPYIKACDEYVKLAQPKVDGTLDAVAGKSKNQMGQQHEQASAALAKLQAEKVQARVDIPEKGFPTIKHNLLDDIQALQKNPPKNDAERKKLTDAAQKIGKIQPLVLALNAHLYEIFMAYNETSLYGELVTAYPLAAAVAIGNAQRQGLVDPDKELMRKEVRRVLEAARKPQAQAAAVMALYAEYQAAVAGAIKPEALDQTVSASRESIDQVAPVTDAEVDGVIKLADKALAEAAAKEEELKKLAEQTMRPPPPKPAGEGAAQGAGDAASAVLGLLGSIATGNIMGIVQNAAALVPEDNPLGAAVHGAAAIARGDFKAALSSASKIAPNTKLGAVVTQVHSTVKTVDQAVGAAKDAKPHT
jgi:hypothetical protein